jgi:hypothetical protein
VNGRVSSTEAIVITARDIAMAGTEAAPDADAAIVAPTITTYALSNNVLLGDAIPAGMTSGTGAVTGMAISEYELGRFAASSGLNIHAGTAAASGGHILIGDAVVNAANLPALNLFAGTGKTVHVAGVFAPSVNGGTALTIGKASDWTPGTIIVTGSLGSVPAAASARGADRDSQSEWRAFKRVDLTARDQVLIGYRPASTVDANGNGVIDDGEVSAMTAALREQSESTNVTRGVAPGLTATTAAAGHVFVASSTFNIVTDGRVVQQNTSREAGGAAGVLVTNRDGVAKPFTYGFLTSEGTAAAANPIVIDLFMTLRTGAGRWLVEDQVAAAADVADGALRNQRYRINSCTIGSAGVCLPSQNLNVVFPERLAEGLIVTPEDQDEDRDATVIGAGNEEIWVKP